MYEIALWKTHVAVEHFPKTYEKTIKLGTFKKYSLFRKKLDIKYRFFYKTSQVDFEISYRLFKKNTPLPMLRSYMFDLEVAAKWNNETDNAFHFTFHLCSSCYSLIYPTSFLFFAKPNFSGES